MSVSVFDHPWLAALLGDEEVARHFSVEAELRAMLEFEVALAMAEAELGIVPMEAAQAIAAVALSFQPDLPALSAATLRDGVVVRNGSRSCAAPSARRTAATCISPRPARM
jgi:3-carboxy-cis,cis-muconate cycloisomerase